MQWIVISGVKPWDGRYEFDIAGQELTTREWGWIKRLTGYMPLTIDKGFDGGDPELFAAFAAIALRRADKIEGPEVPDVYERIIDGPQATTITLAGDESEQDDAGPPAPSSTENGSSFGPGSPTNLENWELSPRPSGSPRSDTSTSPRPTSGK